MPSSRTLSWAERGRDISASIIVLTCMHLVGRFLGAGKLSVGGADGSAGENGAVCYVRDAQLLCKRRHVLEVARVRRALLELCLKAEGLHHCDERSERLVGVRSPCRTPRSDMIAGVQWGALSR